MSYQLNEYAMLVAVEDSNLDFSLADQRDHESPHLACSSPMPIIGHEPRLTWSDAG